MVRHNRVGSPSRRVSEELNMKNRTGTGLLVLALLVAACGDSDGQADAAGAAATTPATAAPATTTEAPTAATTVAPAPATSTAPPTTTAPRALGDTEGLFATPEEMQDLAEIYCSSWPAVGEWLSAEPRFVAVPAEGWDPDRDQAAKGLDAAVSAVATQNSIRSNAETRDSSLETGSSSRCRL